MAIIVAKLIPSDDGEGTFVFFPDSLGNEEVQFIKSPERFIADGIDKMECGCSFKEAFSFMTRKERKWMMKGIMKFN